MKPLLSILIPACNAEKYIVDCLESIFSQAEEGIEYVIVDDGCSDGTMEAVAEVCGRFPEASKSLKTVTHEANKGLPASRHDALQAADGEYVLFVDADDSLEPGACSVLMRAVRSSKPDMICFFLQ
jgi:Glycosyltransferases involved in cell wall biogenesis